jgi:multicomponent Na+:H+ antiporter subunit E
MDVTEAPGKKEGGKAFSILLTFVIAFSFWMLFSIWNMYLLGHYDLFRLARGIIVAVIIAITMHQLLIPGRGEKGLVKLRRWCLYALWELWQIVLAAVDVAMRVLGIRPLDPRIIEFETTLRSDLALTTFGDSITLTPGTITIDIDPERGKYVVHAIDQGPGDALTVDQTMQKKVGYVFMEE